MIEKFTLDRILAGVLGCLLCIQIFLLLFYNLRDTRTLINADAASAIYHFMEVIDNGTLNIPDWNHTTTLELDSAFLFAVPLYYVTHDMFLAMGLANGIFILLYFWVIYRIMKLNDISLRWIFSVLILTFTPWAVGMLDYFNMMFYQASQYTVKTLVPLVLILLVFQIMKFDFKDRKERGEFIATLVTYTILLYSTSLSTGIYTIVCGIFPIIMGVMYTGICNKFTRPKWIRLSCLLLYSGGIFLIGFMKYKELYPSTSKYNLNITLAAEFWKNLCANVVGFFQVLGALPSMNVSGMSMQGIVLCVKFIFCIVFLACILSGTRKLNFTQKQDLLNNLLTYICLVNLFIVTIYDTRYGSDVMQYRYYIITIIPLLILCGYRCEFYFKKMHKYQHGAFCCGFLAFLLVIIVGNNRTVLGSLHNNDYAVTICDYLDTLDVESVIFIDDQDTTALCRGIDHSKKYGCFSSAEQQLQTQICTYQASNHGAFYGDKNVLAVVDGVNLEDVLPEEIARQYTLIGAVKWFNIYYCDHMLIP